MSVKRRTSYPVMMEPQHKLHTEEPQEVCKQQSPSKRGRPKGSQNQHRREVTLGPDLGFVQETINRVLKLMGDHLTVMSVVLDGAFGPHDALHMVRQLG